VLSDPGSLLNLSPPPLALVTTASSGWDGAFLADVTTAPAGEYRLNHEVVVIEHWRAPVLVRPANGPAGWTSHAPGFQVCVPGDAQHGAWRGTVQAQFLFVTPERVEAVLGTPWDRTGLLRWRGARTELPFVSRVLSALMRDCESGFPAGPLAGDALIVALLTFLDGRARVGRAPRPRGLGRRLGAVLEYIDANLARPLRLIELAGMAGVGVRRFSTIFMAETGWSPHRYVLNRRIERAKSLMLDTRLTLGEVAQAVGVSDQAQFSKLFRQYTGETPSAYRRR
jgi:AraC-like DNA-binding protein